MNKKFIIIGSLSLLLLIFVTWLFVESSKPPPGEKIADLGRGHVSIGEVVEYNSNPPVSGKHYEEWVKAGVYESPRDDRNLVHSLEHGYIIMSYNCDFKPQSFSLVKNVYAHGIEEEATPSPSEATSSASLSDNFRSEDCHKLVDQLISIYEKKGKTRLIVIPRPTLDARISLTAWGYIDKFNDFDEQEVTKFIDTYLNMGPEKTMESAGN